MVSFVEYHIQQTKTVICYHYGYNNRTMLLSVHGEWLKNAPTPDGVPQDIRSKYQSITLSIDIMYVSKLPFLLTVSHGLHFGTVEYLPNRQISTVSQAIRKDAQLYQLRGFTMGVVKANLEFQPISEQLQHLQLNICAQNEHVSTIERFIRTVKECP